MSAEWVKIIYLQREKYKACLEKQYITSFCLAVKFFLFLFIEIAVKIEALERFFKRPVEFDYHLSYPQFQPCLGMVTKNSRS